MIFLSEPFENIILRRRYHCNACCGQINKFFINTKVTHAYENIEVTFLFYFIPSGIRRCRGKTTTIFMFVSASNGS